MNSEVLSRYDLTPDKKFIINVNIPDFHSLFDNYDDPSSFYERDLNERFVEHLIECVEEIGVNNDAVVEFRIPEGKKSSDEEKNVLFSIKSFFEYMISLSERDIKEAFTRFTFHIGISLVCFVIFMLMGGGCAEAVNGIKYFFTTGLAVSAWVLIITGFSRFLFRIKSQLSEIKLYRKVIKMEIKFNYE